MKNCYTLHTNGEEIILVICDGYQTVSQNEYLFQGIQHMYSLDTVLIVIDKYTHLNDIWSKSGFGGPAPLKHKSMKSARKYLLDALYFLIHTNFVDSRRILIKSVTEGNFKTKGLGELLQEEDN